MLDKELQSAQTAININNWNSDTTKPYKKIRHELSVYQGIAMKGNQIIIPKQHQQQILDTVHLSHQGMTKTKALLREKAWWPTINNDTEKLISNCYSCQVTSPATPTHSPISMTDLPKSPWSVLAADIKGLYPTGDYLFVIGDYNSRYPMVVKLKSTTSTKFIQHLDSIFNQFGLPDHLITDNDSQFTSEEFENYLKSKNINHQTTLPYMPQQNEK